MKILFCTNKFDEVSNGPAKFANMLLDINRQYPEHEIRILTEDTASTIPFVYKLNLKYPKSLTLLSNFYRIRQYHRTAAIIRTSEFPFDVIVYNNAFIGLLSSIRWKDTIGMVNDYNNACRFLKNFRFNYIFLKQFIFKQLERLTVNCQHTIIVNSKFLAEYLSTAYNEPIGKFKILYKGVDLPKQISRMVLDPSKPIKVLFVKTEFKLGGLQTLISALGKSSYFFELTVIGPKPEFRAQIESLNKGNTNVSLSFKGYQTQSSVFEHLLQTHLYIVPSFREALGVSNLEALSLGVPVISTNVGGIPEVLKNGDCGWMVEPGNEMGLAFTIEQCIENKELRMHKIHEGLSHVKQFYKENVLKIFIEILCDHVKKRGNKKC